jgi:hypothetical protein
MRKQWVMSIAAAALLAACSGSDTADSPPTTGSAVPLATTTAATGATRPVVPAADLAGGRQICSLVSADEVGAAFGVMAQPGEPVADGQRNSCTFVMADNSVVVTGLLEWSDALNAEADATQAIDGIGERAWFLSPALNVKSGDLDLVVVTTANNVPGAAALAKVIIPRL